jgi:hypothetical protein
MGTDQAGTGLCHRSMVRGTIRTGHLVAHSPGGPQLPALLLGNRRRDKSKKNLTIFRNRRTDIRLGAMRTIGYPTCGPVLLQPSLVLLYETMTQSG